MPSIQPSITECRTLLGDEACGKSDTQVEAMRDELTQIASALYANVNGRAKEDIEAVRWMAHYQEHPEDAAEIIGGDD